MPRSALACAAQLSFSTRAKNCVHAAEEVTHPHPHVELGGQEQRGEEQVEALLSCMASAIRRFSSIATTGGMSQIGLNTKASIDSEAASSSRNAMRVTMLNSIEMFSNQRSRRFGCSG